MTKFFPLRSLSFFLLVALLSVGAAACGGDDEDAGDGGGNGASEEPSSGDNGADASANDDDSADAGDAAGEDGEADDGDEANDGDDGDGGGQPAPSGDGSGTLVIDDITLEFEVRFCAFDEDDTGNEDVPFTLVGYATDDDGRELGVDASIVDLGDETLGEIHGVSIYDTDSFEEVYASASTFGGDAAEFQIDGTNVSYEGEFWGTTAKHSLGAGTFQAACP
ncbi:MAG: hypothetical protein U5Q44_00800 [Dehalococcoidia bacterium]|nr:hypothetical protein [Dehalococcoidia bacterium]